MHVPWAPRRLPFPLHSDDKTEKERLERYSSLIWLMFLEIRVGYKNRLLFVCLFVFFQEMFLKLKRRLLSRVGEGGVHYMHRYTPTMKLHVSHRLTLLLMKLGRSLPDLRDGRGGVLAVGKFRVNGFQHLLCVCWVLDPFQEREPPWTAGHLEEGGGIQTYTHMHTLSFFSSFIPRLLCRGLGMRLASLLLRLFSPPTKVLWG